MRAAAPASAPARSMLERQRAARMFSTKAKAASAAAAFTLAQEAPRRSHAAARCALREARRMQNHRPPGTAMRESASHALNDILFDNSCRRRGRLAARKGSQRD